MKKDTIKQNLIKMFLEQKNMTYDQCSKEQKKVFNDDYDHWERYDWEWLADKPDTKIKNYFNTHYYVHENIKNYGNKLQTLL